MGVPESIQHAHRLPTESMSTYTQDSNKGMAAQSPPGKDEMIPCGTYTMRPSSDDRTVGDGINGTITLQKSWLDTINVDPKDHIWFHAEANAKEIDTILQVHASGRSVTLPREDRQQLNLEPDDEVNFWITKASEEQIPQDQKQDVRKTFSEDEDEMEKRVIIFGDEQFTYHYAESEDETNCGIPLDQREFRDGFEDPPDFFDLCADCAVLSSEEMTNEQIIEWLSQEAGFQKSGGTPSYLNHDQLVALRDSWLEMQERIEELEEQIVELQD